jgi:hypothetical protein
MGCSNCKNNAKEKQVLDLVQKIQELTAKINSLESELVARKKTEQKDSTNLTFLD